MAVPRTRRRGPDPGRRDGVGGVGRRERVRDASVENWAIDPGAVRAWQRGVVPAGAQRGVGDRATRGRAAYVPPNVVVAVRPRGYARVGTRKRARRDRLVRAGFQRRAQRVSRRVAPPPNRLYVTRAGEDTGDVPTGDAGGHRGALHGGRGGTRRAARARKGRGLWVTVERHAHNAGDAACRLARGDGAVRGSRPSRHQRRVDR